MNNLNPLQTAISDLREICDRNQGVNHETSLLVKQMELLVEEIERKTRKRKITVEIPVPPLSQGVPVV